MLINSVGQDFGQNTTETVCLCFPKPEAMPKGDLAWLELNPSEAYTVTCPGVMWAVSWDLGWDCSWNIHLASLGGWPSTWWPP